MCKVSSEPTLVQLTRVDLRVVGQPENPIPGADLSVTLSQAEEGEGWIKVTPPSEMQVYAEGLNCLDVSELLKLIFNLIDALIPR